MIQNHQSQYLSARQLEAFLHAYIVFILFLCLHLWFSTRNIENAYRTNDCSSSSLLAIHLWTESVLMDVYQTKNTIFWTYSFTVFNIVGICFSSEIFNRSTKSQAKCQLLAEFLPWDFGFYSNLPAWRQYLCFERKML